MKKYRWLIILFLIGSSGAALIVFGAACSRPSEISKPGEPIVPELIFRTRDGEDAFTFPAARDISVAPDDAFYIFDYMNNIIRKYDETGRHLVSFGGQGDGDGRFTHLTGIRAASDRLLALDSIGFLEFSPEGEFRTKRTFPNEVLSDHPAIFPDGRFIGSQILADELVLALTLRSEAGEETARIAEYDLHTIFPKLKIGEDFFLSMEQAPFYVYAVTPNNEILWASSDSFRILRFLSGESRPFFSGEFTPVAFPTEERTRRLERQAKVSPPLHMYVPEEYQLIHHILVETGGDIWVYLKSLEKTGFLHYSERGRLLGFHPVQADFDMTSIIVRMFNDRFYFLVTGRKSAEVYSAGLPGSN